MMSRRKLTLALTLGLLAACENMDQPLDPAWGKQRCGHCSMLVEDKRFTAEAVTVRGERLFFDDPGCLASYELEHAAPKHAWVLSEGQWLETGAARFDTGARTPMDYGFEARHDGKLDWIAVKNASRDRNLLGAR